MRNPSNLETEALVSIYPHIKESKKGQIIPLGKVIEGIKNGQWKNEILSLRTQINIKADKEQIDRIKQQLPYFTVSGTFEVRKDTGLIKHSGKIAIDFDKVIDLEKTKQILANDKYTEYIFASCSGRGYCVIVNINPLKHLESFLELEKYYFNVYQITIDKACKDISRPRYVSWDDQLIHNLNCEAFITSDLNLMHLSDDEEKYLWVKNIHEKKHHFIEGQRHHYLIVLAHFLNKVGVTKEFCSQRLITEFCGNGMDEKEIGDIILHCYKNTFEYGSFVINKKNSELPSEFSDRIKNVFVFAHNKNNAGNKFIDEDIKCMSSQNSLPENIVRNIFKSVFENNKESFGIDQKEEIYKVEVFIKKKYQIVRNEITHRLESRIIGKQQEFEELNIDSIYRDLQHATFKFTLDKLKSLLRSNYIELYNPFKVYFQNLPKWDEGDIDHINNLSSYIKTDNDIFWRSQFKKALVRSLACSLDYKENRIIITLIGQKQETGKSSFIRFLCPPDLSQYYSETMLDGSKDSDIQLSENFIWNLEELAILHNSDINKLKAIISKTVVKQRRPYGEFAESNPRRANFWASTNKVEFLTDDENTRWLCFNVISINHDYNNSTTGIKEIDINMVWAQAYSLYMSGYKYNLTYEETLTRENINKDFETHTLEKQLILLAYKPCDKDEGEFMTNADILISLTQSTESKFRLNINTIAKAMNQLDFVSGRKKINKKVVRGYYVMNNNYNGLTSIYKESEKPF